MTSFLSELKEQRWDDHRYYHHSRINQSLHLVSALSFLCAYALAFADPAKAARQALKVIADYEMDSLGAGNFPCHDSSAGR